MYVYVGWSELDIKVLFITKTNTVDYYVMNHIDINIYCACMIVHIFIYRKSSYYEKDLCMYIYIYRCDVYIYIYMKTKHT